MKIRIIEYDANRNEYRAEIGGVDCKFDPFVTGWMNDENYDREKIEELVGKTLDLNIRQATSGVWLPSDEPFNPHSGIID